MAKLGLPTIPGVPMFIIPEFVHAIRVATKFYAKCHDQPYYYYDGRDNSQDANTNNDPASATTRSAPLVLNAWMQRMEAVTTEGSETNPESQELQERNERMHDATGKWLETITRLAKSSRSQQQNYSNSTNEGSRQEESSLSESSPVRMSVPYACFLYIWELQQTHERIAVRRAGLYLTGLLLQRSRDCRFHLEQEDHLDQWMKATLLDYRPTKSMEDLPLLQSEADYWLNYLVEQGYAQLYPKIRVASQRLRQQCPHLQTVQNLPSEASPSSSTTKTTFSSMVDWRKIRDIALEYGDKEIVQVQRWIDRSHECLEILVPRVGVDQNLPNTGKLADPLVESKEASSRKGGNDNGGDDDDDEDDDIDWEDGGEDVFDDGTGNMPLPDFEHFSAVERTLAAMESAGGLRGGEMEIDFRNDSHKNEEKDFGKPVDADTEKERAEALAKFQKCVSLLSKRHMPRLSVWLEGLRHADNLVVSSKTKALVSLPSDKGARRSQLVLHLSELKQTVSSVLKSAVRLDVSTSTGNEGTETHATTRESSSSTSEVVTLPSLGLSSNSNRSKSERRENLMASVERQKTKSRSKRSNRIQIKFRSR
jgi:hypothetical protein